MCAGRSCAIPTSGHVSEELADPPLRKSDFSALIEHAIATIEIQAGVEFNERNVHTQIVFKDCERITKSVLKRPAALHCLH